MTLRHAVVVLSTLCVGLALTCALLFRGLAQAKSGSVFFGEDALRDPEVQRQVIQKLTEGNNNTFDSHPDADVARVLLPNSLRGTSTTNAMGMRERAFALEKPAGVVRIVLLGDSYVFGLNVAEAERFGAVLEQELGARAAEPQPRFECLHLAVNSWNIESECAYLRRQLDRLRPNLVIQVTYSNDLDDVTGVRGFGTEASFAPRHPERGDSLLLDRFAQSFLGQDTRNFLSRGEDWESRTRFAGALAAVQRLRATMAELPDAPRHLLVVHWGPLAPTLYANLGAELEADTQLYLPLELATDKTNWVTPIDPHWSPKGNALVAQCLYGTIRARNLLPGVTLGAWPEADALAAAWAPRGLEFARDPENRRRLQELLKNPVAVIDLPELTKAEAGQVHGGLDREGRVSPYCSLVLQRPAGARELVVRGRALPDVALKGARTRIFLEELELGAFELAPDAELALDVPIPPALDGRAFLNLRFESSDYVYRGDDQRHCVVFQLQRAALE
ncbi:MAG: hypothetical protein EXS08_11165 [Planctomycetes bacterium]|nr:hypothetical protein [Planctomycetota bacterium]